MKNKRKLLWANITRIYYLPCLHSNIQISDQLPQSSTDSLMTSLFTGVCCCCIEGLPMTVKTDKRGKNLLYKKTKMTHSSWMGMIHFFKNLVQWVINFIYLLQNNKIQQLCFIISKPSYLKKPVYIWRSI